jgi:hypothetical protein
MEYRKARRSHAVAQQQVQEDQQSDTRNNTKRRESDQHSEIRSDIGPGQTLDVRVLQYCFKPPLPRTAASPPPRPAETLAWPSKVRRWVGWLAAGAFVDAWLTHRSTIAVCMSVSPSPIRRICFAR